MTLSFSTHINGKPTHFVEKIWTAFNLGSEGYQIEFKDRKEWLLKCSSTGNIDIEKLVQFGIKIHTIREDKPGRWRRGMPIHFVVKNRTPQRFQFAPVLPVVLLQKIKIYWVDGVPIVLIDGEVFFDSIIGINQGIEELAINDGFESKEDFFKYFNTDFSGKIIHWTDKIYALPF